MTKMSSREPLAIHPADLVWRKASDGRWRTRKDFEQELLLDREGIGRALDFLVKYGFVKRRGMSGESFRAIVGAPSPGEVVEGLLGLLGTGAVF